MERSVTPGKDVRGEGVNKRMMMRAFLELRGDQVERWKSG